MKANEIRLGNWVCEKEFKSGDILFDKKERQVQPADIIITYEFLEPIPLTEEWLNRFGFQKDWEDFEYFKKIDGVREGTYSILGICLWSDGVMEAYKATRNNEDAEINYVESDVLLSEVKHVHQLQNLYFALTGEELELI